MLTDYKKDPTVFGTVVAVFIGEDGAPDILHVQAIAVDKDIGNLIQVVGDIDKPDPNRPFCIFGKTGSIEQHGYTSPERLIGKNCLIWSGGRFDVVAIEPDNGENWLLVTWKEYI